MIDPPPVINTNSTVTFVDDNPIFRIGNDFCLELDQDGMPANGVTSLTILCLHNETFPLFEVPTAYWEFNEITIPDSSHPSIFLLSQDISNGRGINGVLTISPLTPTSAFVGTYVCNLTNTEGSSIAQSTIGLYNDELVHANDNQN